MITTDLKIKFLKPFETAFIQTSETELSNAACSLLGERIQKALFITPTDAGRDDGEPTTHVKRFGDAMQALCGGKRPPDEMLLAWLNPDADDERLQGYAGEHGLSWAQGLGVIDAALLVASQPTEGADHEFLDQSNSQRAKPAAPEVRFGTEAQRMKLLTESLRARHSDDGFILQSLPSTSTKEKS